MGHDYDIEEKIRRTLYFTSIMMYDKAYNHISNSIPGSVPKNGHFLQKSQFWNEV